MGRYLKQVFENLQWYERVEYILMLLLMLSIPLSWRMATFVEMALLVSVVAVRLCQRHHNSRLITVSQTPARWCCYAMMAFFVVYLISGLCSTNQSAGIDIAVGKLSFVGFAVMVLVGDWRWVTRNHLRLIFYVLWVELVVLFLVCLASAAVQFAQGTPLTQLIGCNFVWIHHSYVALFAVVAMVFGYAEAMELVGKEGKAWLGLLFAGEVVLALFVAAVDSRAGMLSIALLLIVWAVDYIVYTRRWGRVLIVTVLLAACGAGLYSLVPPEHQRLGQAYRNLVAGERVDYRGLMARSGFEALEGHWLTGLGSGDYLEPLHERYATNGFMEGVEKDMGTHNQYVETLLECGLPGTILLVAILLLPLFPVSGFKFQVSSENPSKPLHPYTLTPLHPYTPTPLHPYTSTRLVWGVVLAIALALLFESILGRQMGIIFITYTISLILLWKSCGVLGEPGQS